MCLECCDNKELSVYLCKRKAKTMNAQTILDTETQVLISHESGLMDVEVHSKDTVLKIKCSWSEQYSEVEIYEDSIIDEIGNESDFDDKYVIPQDIVEKITNYYYDEVHDEFDNEIED